MRGSEVASPSSPGNDDQFWRLPVTASRGLTEGDPGKLGFGIADQFWITLLFQAAPFASLRLPSNARETAKSVNDPEQRVKVERLVSLTRITDQFWRLLTTISGRFTDHYWSKLPIISGHINDHYWIDCRSLLDTITDHFRKVYRPLLDTFTDHSWIDCRSLVESFTDHNWSKLPISYELLEYDLPAKSIKNTGRENLLPCLSVCLMLLCCLQGNRIWKSLVRTSRSSRSRRPS